MLTQHQGKSRCKLIHFFLVLPVVREVKVRNAADGSKQPPVKLPQAVVG